MSIFSKQVSQITTADLQELIDEKAVENVRLEFKRKEPSKDEEKKKLSSFANTYGGYLVIGAEADSKDGKVTKMPGVENVKGVKQRLVQWCYDSVFPPLHPEVSEPITAPSDSGCFCYVVYVAESEQTPHFINGRKGIYVRTNEFSQKFEPQLATYKEIQQLSNRRELILERRRDLILRAQMRFQSLIETHYSELGKKEDGIGSYLTLALIPRYPSRRICEHLNLLNTVRTEKLNWRGVGFPRITGGIVSQHESVLVLHPGSSFSIFEANIWGLLFYATEIERPSGESHVGIHLNHFLGQLLVFLKHASSILQKLTHKGPLFLQLNLEKVKNIPWIYFTDNIPRIGPKSIVDDSVMFTISSTIDQLVNRRDEIAIELLRYIFFALNWPEVASTEGQLKSMVKLGNEYNR